MLINNLLDDLMSVVNNLKSNRNYCNFVKSLTFDDTILLTMATIYLITIKYNNTKVQHAF